MHRLKILIADDMEHVRMILEERIEKSTRYIFRPDITLVDSAELAVQLAKEAFDEGKPFDLALLDIDFSQSANSRGMSGHEASALIKDASPTTIQAIVSALGDEEHLHKAAKNSAISRFFRRKSFHDEEIFWVCFEALVTRLHREQKLLSPELTVYTQSKNMVEYLNRLDRIRPDKNVIIYGETGTGKELSARRINANASLAKDQRARPFVSINCGLLNGDTVEARLFGYVRGAFTGAHSDTKGYFDLAKEGDIFLDEFQNAPIELQQILMRVIQEKCYSPVGKPSLVIPLQARFIAAVNKILSSSRNDGEIMPDIVARLKQDYVHIPALRDRPEDIPLLVKVLTGRHGNADKTFSPDAIETLKKMPWPENIRGLESLCISALEHCKLPVITKEAVIELADLSGDSGPQNLVDTESKSPNEMVQGFVDRVFDPKKNIDEILSAVEHALLKKSWQIHRNVTDVAKQAGLPYNTAKRRLIHFGLFSKSS